MTDDIKNPHIARAIELAGGTEAKLAALIGFSQVAINKARKRAHTTPRMAIAIERGLNGQITRQEMCPEFFGDPASAA